MANSITNTNTRIATTIEDFFKELLKLLDQSDAFEKDSLFLGALKKDGNAPALVNVDTVIAKRLVHEMEKSKYHICNSGFEQLERMFSWSDQKTCL